MEQLTYIAEIVKTSAEKRAFSIDYTDRMPAGASLTSCAISAANRFTGATDNTVVSSTTATTSGNVASVFIQAGTLGQAYDVRYLATLSDGSILADYVGLEIKAIRR